MTIEPLCELDNKMLDEKFINITQKYVDLMNTDISKKWLLNSETTYVSQLLI